MSKRKACNLINEVMAEAVRMPGCPQLIVTRGWLWSWLARMGYERDTRETTFGSVDYMVFSHTTRPTVDEPLTDLDQPWVKRLLALMEAHCAS